MQHEVNEFMAYVKKELARGIDDWEQRLSTALVKSSPTDLVRAAHAAQAAASDGKLLRPDAACRRPLTIGATVRVRLMTCRTAAELQHRRTVALS